MRRDIGVVLIIEVVFLIAGSVTSGQSVQMILMKEPLALIVSIKGCWKKFQMGEGGGE